jgi:hypothetical protein
MVTEIKSGTVKPRNLGTVCDVPVAFVLNTLRFSGVHVAPTFIESYHVVIDTQR